MASRVSDKEHLGTNNELSAEVPPDKRPFLIPQLWSFNKPRDAPRKGRNEQDETRVPVQPNTLDMQKVEIQMPITDNLPRGVI